MPRTFLPEEEKRVTNVTNLKNQITPNESHKVQVDEDADGEPNFFYWDPSGDAATADGVSVLESGISSYGNGGANEGVWRRVRLPFSAATTDDLSEGSSNLYYTSGRVKDEFSAGGDITYSKNPTIGYDIANASFNDSLSVSSEDGTPSDVAFNGDGTKLFITGIANDNVYEYSLGTAYDISTASFADSFNVTTEGDNPQGLAFNGDGTKLFIADGNANIISEYGLTTGFDISTASVNTTFDISGQTGGASEIALNNDGTKVFISDNNDVIYEYDLGNAYDISTATYNNNSFDVSAQSGGSTRGLEFNGDGTEMFIADFTNSDVYKYTLSTGFDVTTASFSNESFDVTPQTSDAYGLGFGSDGTLMYVPDTNGTVYEYSSGSTASAAEFTLDVSSLSASELFGSKTTDDLPEGSTNEYFTDERAQDAVGTILGSNFTYDDAGNAITLANDSVTVAGNTVSLGGSTTVAAGDLSDIGDTTQTDGNALISDGSNFVSEPLSTAAENHVALTDLSNVGTDVDGRPQLPDLPSISGSTSPSKDSDLATKIYVDGLAQGLEIKDSVDVASTGNIDLASATDPNPVDGYTLSDGEFILLKDQTTATENGIYVATTATDPTTWTRRADFDDDADVVSGSITFVENGTNNADVSYIVTSDDPITVGTDDILFTIFSRAGTLQGGDGITKSGQTLDVNVSDFAGTNLTTETGGDTNDDLAITDETIQDSVYNNVLSGTQSRITVTYDDANGEVDYVVDSDLSNYSFTNVTTDDVSEGSNNLYYTDTRVKNDFQAAGDITYTKDTLVNYDVANASLNDFFDVSGQGTNPQAITFNDDGTKLFTADATNADVYSYTLSTPYDASTATFANTLDVSTENIGSPKSVEFNGDGTRIIVADNDGDIQEYTLSSAYDLSSTVTPDGNINITISALESITFNNDGTKLFISDSGNRDVEEYTLTTAYRPSQGVTIQNTIDVNGVADNPTGIIFNDDGTELFILNDEGVNEIVQYNLSSAYDLSTASLFADPLIDVTSSTTAPRGIAFDDVGSRMYLIDSGDTAIYEYNIQSGTGAAEFSLDVSSLSASDLFGSKTTDDLPEGSINEYFTDERAQDAVGTILTGSGGATVNYDDGANTITIDASGAGTNVSNGGTQVVSGATDINFGENLTATDDTDGTVTVSNDVNLATATFSGDGIQQEFQIAHGLSSTPDAWTVHATSDAASGISHSTADATNITIVYDTAPPNGTDNITVNYVYEV